MANDQDVPGLPALVAEWPRNARELLRVKLDTFRGNAVVDVRCWYRDKAGELRPGRGGVTLAVKHLPALATALGDALDHAHQLELLPPAE